MSKDSLDKADNQTEITFTLQSPYKNENLRLVARHWLVPGVSKPHAVVLFVHGSGEHCQRYRHVAKFFVKASNVHVLLTIYVVMDYQVVNGALHLILRHC